MTAVRDFVHHHYRHFNAAALVDAADGSALDDTAAFVARNARKLDDAVDPAADQRFEYFGLRTVADRYLLRHPESRLVVETPQYWLLRVACGLSHTPGEAIGFYRLMSSLAYLPSSPTLFNAGTRHTQMSSCFLVDSPRDDLDSIYERYQQVARLSKFSGGIGISWVRVRGRGALIRGTNGRSNGIVPFLKTLDAGVHTHIWSSPVVAETVLGSTSRDPHASGLARGTTAMPLPLPR